MSLALDFSCKGQGGFRLQLACEIPATGVTAIYGPSGSGKSTLLDCIAGLRQPDTGSIRFATNDWSHNGKSTPAWKRRVAYVFQEARLFPHLTVQGNLDYAAQRAAAKGPMSADELVTSLGLTSLLAQKPDTLSAGQKQRVAIARTIIKNPRILIFDDATSSVDLETEADIRQALEKLMEDRTTFIIAHRIQSVMKADLIVVLDKGRIIQIGTHQELLAQEGVYRKIYDIQTQIEVQLEKEVASAEMGV